MFTYDYILLSKAASACVADVDDLMVENICPMIEKHCATIHYGCCLWFLSQLNVLVTNCLLATSLMCKGVGALRSLLAWRMSSNIS